MRLFITLLSILGLLCYVPPLVAQDCGCDHVVTQAGTYRPASQGSSAFALNVLPGQTICIQAGNYGDLRFYGFKGTADEPITIKNCGGVVNLSNSTFHGFSFENCRHILLSGNGDSSAEYGIRINGTGTGASGVSVSGKSSDFLIEHVEVTSAAFAGIMMKTDPTCDPKTWRDSFEMRNVVLHHNYVHDVGGEGFYIGNSFFTEGYPTMCGGLPKRVYPHRIFGLEIYDNIVRRSGAEGIQYGCAPNANVHDNLVEDAGIAPFDVFQNNAIQIGDGSGGKCYQNTVRRCGGGAISAVGNVGGLKIYNNLLIRAGTTGIYADDNASTPNGSTLEIYNNSIIRTGGDGIHLRTERNSNLVRNNWLVATGYAAYFAYMEGATATLSNNVTTPSVNTAHFVDTVHYRPTVASPTVNVGMNLTNVGVIDDLLSIPRPQGSAYDAGVYEFIACTGTDRVVPVIRNCPKSFTVYTSASTSQVAWTPPTATDNCSVPTLTTNVAPNGIYALGKRTVTYTALDAAKNKATCSFSFTVVKNTNCKTDVIKPAIFGCPRDTVINPTAYPVFVNWTPPTATDNCQLKSFTSNYLPNTPLIAGNYTVVYTATDDRGNRDSCRFSVIIARQISQCDIDTTKPYFVNCPRDSTVFTNTRAAVVTWREPTAYDNCIVPITRSNYLPNQNFTIGNWEVRYVARDLKNNVDTCRFRIKITNPCDTERVNPVMSRCPRDTVFNVSHFFTTVSWTPPTATDNCSDLVLSANFQPNTVFGIGTRTIVYTARDRAGNSASCQFNVTVNNTCANDTVKPVFVNCPRDTTVYTGGNAASMAVSWIAPTATDNCTTTPSVFSTIAPNSVFQVGTRTVNYVANDQRGNSATCQFRVTVANAAMPVFGLMERKATEQRLVMTYQVYPNPSNDGLAFFTIYLLEDVEVKVKITDMNGKIVSQKAYQGKQGVNNWEFDFSNFSEGNYLLCPSVKWLHLRPIKLTRLY
jgi:HYR domain/Right handed beta helix region/Secretion system C-terminal sorting domain